VHARLSAGQRRRLAFAIAMVRTPRLLLLDEPHAGLDTEGRAALDAVLAGSASAGRSVVLVSHELERARPLSSREVVLTAGQANGALPETDPPEPGAPGPTVARGATTSGSRS
jgi:ABC-type sulfate/molybdate transport systems ATPase subunit